VSLGNTNTLTIQVHVLNVLRFYAAFSIFDTIVQFSTGKGKL